MASLQNQEILDSFAEEIREIINLLKGEISQLTASKLKDTNHFENFGQIVDRIYGTATTLGYQDIGDYTKKLKELCYKCAQSENDKGREKTMFILIESIRLLESLAKSVHNSEEIKKIRLALSIEKGKAENLCRTVFQNITKTSCN